MQKEHKDSEFVLFKVAVKKEIASGFRDAISSIPNGGVVFAAQENLVLFQADELIQTEITDASWKNEVGALRSLILQSKNFFNSDNASSVEALREIYTSQKRFLERFGKCMSCSLEGYTEKVLKIAERSTGLYSAFPERPVRHHAYGRKTIVYVPLKNCLSPREVRILFSATGLSGQKKAIEVLNFEEGIVSSDQVLRNVERKLYGWVADPR